jgi:DNA (cytosine-5)-methyltransferase 1
MKRPRLLDLFCGAGGCAVGYHRAGFRVHGVDMDWQANYPFRFLQWDALRINPRDFDVIHASPPCQLWSMTAYRTGKTYPDLITPLRERLAEWGKPYIIENVEGAPLKSAAMLCGRYFDLGTPCKDGVYRYLRRHRYFESTFDLTGTGCHCVPGDPIIGVYGQGSATTTGRRGYQGTVKEREIVMGIDWMYSSEMSQAIPPVYTEYLGRQILEQM